jgi:heme A synthase
MPARLTRHLLRCGAVAGPLSVAGFTLDGATRSGYSPARHPVSALALGPRGWMQTSNFIVTGTLCLAGAAGLRRADPSAGALAPASVAVAGCGLLAAAAWPTDPVPGYPLAGNAPERPSGVGLAHLGAAVLFFVGLPLAMLASAKASRGAGSRAWAGICLLCATNMSVNAAQAGQGFAKAAEDPNSAGLSQRASIIFGLGWLSVACTRALRRP